MNETDTPETDAARVQFFEVQGRVIVELDPQGDWVSMEFAAKLERERDQARKELSRLTAINAEKEAKRAEFLETLDRKVASMEAELEDRDCPSCGGPMTDNSFRGDPKCRDCGRVLTRAGNCSEAAESTEAVRILGMALEMRDNPKCSFFSKNP